MGFEKLLGQAEQSKWSMRKLNFLLSRMIPFNRKHNIKLASLSHEKVVCSIPYKKANFNHLRGIHACALATVAEYAAGMLLLRNFDAKRYRLIMSNLKVDYFYQAKCSCLATSCWDADALVAVHSQLKEDHQAGVTMVTDIADVHGNHIAKVQTVWQIKDWKFVRTKR